MIFSQANAGAMPMPTETNVRERLMHYRQSSIFGDIQAWDLHRIWTDQCGCGTAQGWGNDFAVTEGWTDSADVGTWTEATTDNNSHIGCP